MLKTLSKTKKTNLTFDFQLREIDGKKGLIKGYASVFNVIDSYGTVIKPGAFKESLDKKGASSIRVLWNHNWDEVIGVCKKAKEDQIGLYVEFSIVNGVQRSEEIFRLIEAGAIDAFSIGFVVLTDEFDRENDVVNITKVDLWEFSPVTFPANKLALVTDVRSQIIEEEEEEEEEPVEETVEDEPVEEETPVEDTPEEDLEAVQIEEALRAIQETNQRLALEQLKTFNSQFNK